ncbi:MAG: NTP transferase domain-containing protein [Rhizobiaceae bacterium]
MKFGPAPVEDAAGAILAHSVSMGATRLRKAHRLTQADVDALAAAGVAEVVVARLETGDVGEDEAAARLADALRHAGVAAKPASTGRVNLHAAASGVFRVDRALVDAVNAVDPSVTLATLADYAAVEAGQMVATVKIIPFAIPGAVLDRAIAVAVQRRAFAVHAFRSMHVGLVQTESPSTKGSVLDKTARVTAERLAWSGSTVTVERRVAHSAAAVAGAIRAMLDRVDMAVLFGASAVSDADDVLPAAIRLAGGEVARVGMPVDPGNLLVLGRIGGKPVIGAPGCARSPKENGFDWVLDRLLAGLDVTDGDIQGMGVGGLLMEIATRPQPREATARTAGRVHAVVLAAGRSTRMGGPNKLLARFDGEPLVRRTVSRVLESRAAKVTVVTGHQSERIQEALVGLKVAFAHNADFATGLSSSIRTGVAALPASATGVLVVLGDMPAVTTADLDRMIEGFHEAGDTAVVRATHAGKRGNPVILPRSLFPALVRLEGDTGARHLVEAEGQTVVDVELGEAASADVDTPEAMALTGGVLAG